jgi:hypothetical protein
MNTTQSDLKIKSDEENTNNYNYTLRTKVSKKFNNLSCKEVLKSDPTIILSNDLILHLSAIQSGEVGFVWSTTQLQPPTSQTLSLLGEGSLIEAQKRGSGAYRATRIWQNLMPLAILTEVASRLPTLHRPVEAALWRAGINT